MLVDKDKLVYDSDVDVSYGVWVCPECWVHFGGGGRTMHHDGCSHLPNGYDYSGLEFHFGPTHVERIIQHAERHGEEKEWWGISLKTLKELFPELVPQRT